MDFTLASGSKLTVTMSSFDDADALQTALLNAAKGLKLPDNPMDVDTTDMIRTILEAATSKDVKAALFKCFERALYDGHKVGRPLFDDLEIGERAREDYYEMAIKVIEVNCRPFLKRVFSLFTAFQATLQSIPASR